MENNDENISCNILLIGKTGAGKSSFANYLFNVDVFEASSGSPVTNWENNFQSHSIIDSSGIKINIFDSVGIEDDNQKKWEEHLLKFLSEKQNLEDANKIIHTLFYVVNAAGSRIETNELSILKKIESDFKLSVAVIFTNCDRASSNEIDKLEDIVKANGLNSVQVSSVSTRTRLKEDSKQFGREKALEVILSASYEKIGKDLMLGVIDFFIEVLKDKQTEIIKKIDNSDISIFKITKVDEELEKVLDDIDLELFDMETMLPKKYTNYTKFLEKHEVQYQGKQNIDHMWKLFELLESDIDLDTLIKTTNIGIKIKDIENRLEDNSIWSKITVAKDIAMMAIFIKTTIKDAFKELINVLHNELEKTKDKI